MQAALEAQMKDASKTIALNNLKVTLERIMKGEVGMRVMVWRIDARHAADRKHKALNALLEAQMKAQGQGAGLRILRHIMAWMMKGEVGMRLEIWCTGMKDEVRAQPMLLQQRELEARAADASRGAGLRQLRQTLLHMMQRMVSLRLSIWVEHVASWHRLEQLNAVWKEVEEWQVPHRRGSVHTHRAALNDCAWALVLLSPWCCVP